MMLLFYLLKEKQEYWQTSQELVGNDIKVRLLTQHMKPMFGNCALIILCME